MVAFVTSSLIAIMIAVGAVAYSRRRAPGTPVTWGEAMLGAFLVFFGMFWVYGVVPHQWLAWADNELNWRVDKFFVGPGGILRHQNDGGFMPMHITYVVIRDLIAVAIYGVALAANVALWSIWQRRGTDARPELPVRSAFGRPLIREGSRS